MSKRGIYIGGHSLIFGSTQKDDDLKFWSEAKERIDEYHRKSEDFSHLLRYKLDALESRRKKILASILDGSVTISDSIQKIEDLLDDSQNLKIEAKQRGVRFTPEYGVGRTYIQVSEMLDVVKYLLEFCSGEDLQSIRMHLGQFQ